MVRACGQPGLRGCAAAPRGTTGGAASTAAALARKVRLCIGLALLGVRPGSGGATRGREAPPASQIWDGPGAQLRRPGRGRADQPSPSSPGAARGGGGVDARDPPRRFGREDRTGLAVAQALLPERVAFGRKPWAGIGANLLNLTVVGFLAPRQNRGKPRLPVLASPATARGRGAPPGRYLRLGLCDAFAADLEDQGPARERLHHGREARPHRRWRRGSAPGGLTTPWMPARHCAASLAPPGRAAPVPRYPERT